MVILESLIQVERTESDGIDKSDDVLQNNAVAVEDLTSSEVHVAETSNTEAKDDPESNQTKESSDLTQDEERAKKKLRTDSVITEDDEETRHFPQTQVLEYD